MFNIVYFSFIGLFNNICLCIRKVYVIYFFFELKSILFCSKEMFLLDFYNFFDFFVVVKLTIVIGVFY